MRMPVLDKNFYPMIKALRDFEEVVEKSGNPVAVTLVAERSGGYNYVYKPSALPFSWVREPHAMQPLPANWERFAQAMRSPSPCTMPMRLQYRVMPAATPLFLKQRMQMEMRLEA